jgi:hypothetical protein
LGKVDLPFELLGGADDELTSDPVDLHDPEAHALSIAIG